MEERADHPRLQNHLNRYGINCQLMQGFDGLDMVPMAAEEALPGARALEDRAIRVPPNTKTPHRTV